MTGSSTNWERTLDLVGRIYRAAVDPDAWQGFLSALSIVVGDAAIGLSLDVANPLAQPRSYRVHLREDLSTLGRSFIFGRGVWGPMDQPRFIGGFSRASPSFEGDLIESSIFLHWMEPQGLAPEAPIAHSFGLVDGRPMAGIGIYRRTGGRAFDADDMALLECLAPHLRQAYSIHVELGGESRRRTALSEVMDRLPFGVVLVDRSGRVLATSRSADRILLKENGLSITKGGFARATDPAADEALQRLLELAGNATSNSDGEGKNYSLPIPRPAGRADLSAMVTGLLSIGEEAHADEPTTALFVSDPDADRLRSHEGLSTLYGLTKAECELTALLCEGVSLPDVARIRGVKLSTARSQLKQVFLKTGCSRQSDLVGLVLSGVAAIAERQRKG